MWDILGLKKLLNFDYTNALYVISSLLLHNKETELPQTAVPMDGGFVYDLCIVGGGMFGSAAARHASANPGLKVCLIGPAEPTPEQRPQREIFGAHYDEGRITGIFDTHVEFRVLAKNSMARYKEIEENSGIKFYSPVGCLGIGLKRGRYITAVAKGSLEGNVAMINISDPMTLQQRYPFLTMREDENAFLDNKEAGYLSPRKMVWAQKKISASQGCKIIESVVTGVTPLKDGIHEVMTESMGTIKSKRIIFANGAYINTKSMDTPKPLALKRSKETVIFLELSAEEANRLRSMPAIIRKRAPDANSPDTIGTYILPPIQYPNGIFYLKFGNLQDANQKTDDFRSLEEMKQWYLSEGNKNLVNTHLNFVTELIPGLQFKSLSTTSCILSYTYNEYPYIDKISPTVTIAMGGNGEGAKLSDEIGRIAAHLSLTGEWNSELPHKNFKVVYEAPSVKW